MPNTALKRLLLTRCDVCHSQLLYWTDKGKKARVTRPLYSSACRRITNHLSDGANVAEARFAGQ